MNCTNLEFKTRTASAQAVIEHLNACSNCFDPPLNTRVDIGTYGDKIIDKAVTFEAWENNLLIGLIAAYLNDFESKTCFITNVSILPQYHRRGIAKKLLLRLLEDCKSLGFVKVKLEVSSNNAPALSFYSQHGFSVIEKNGNKLTMEMVLKNE